MLFICTHARDKSLSPLVNGRVNNNLLQTVPDINEALLQLIENIYQTFIHSLLHNTPDIKSTGFRSGLFGGQTSGPIMTY